MLLGGWRPRVCDCGRQTRNERMHKKNRRVGRRRKASNKHPSATCRARRRVASTMRRRPRRPRISASWAESIPRGQARAHAAQASAAQGPLTADESRRASTTCRARCVDEAPEAKNAEDSSVVGRADPRGQARAYAAQAGAAQGPSPRTSHGARQQRVGRVAWTRRRRPGTPRTAASRAELTPPEGRRNRTSGRGRARQTRE